MVPSASQPQLFNRNSWFAWTLCGIISVLAVINMILVSQYQSANGNMIMLTGDTGWDILQIVFAVVAALIISHQPRNRIGWLLMTPALLFTLGQPIAAYLNRLTS